MLEGENSLKTWELSEPPVAGEIMSAKAKPDHRLFYLDYEGQISNGRGVVKKWDVGNLEWRQIDEETMVAEVSGEKLRGRLTLQIKSDGLWQFLVLES